MMLPRLIRLRDTPSYLGMDRHRFNADVRPYLTGRTSLKLSEMQDAPFAKRIMKLGPDAKPLVQPTMIPFRAQRTYRH